MLVSWFRAHVLPIKGLPTLITCISRACAPAVDIVETVSETLRLRFLVERISNLPGENKNLASQSAQLPLEWLAIVVFHRYAKMGPWGSKGWPVNRMISGMLLIATCRHFVA